MAAAKASGRVVESDMACSVVLAVLLSLLAPLAFASPDTVARALVPVLRDLRSTLVVERGTSTLSPFSGRDSTLIAVRVGSRVVNMPPDVLDVVNRLIAWKPGVALSAADEEIVTRWVERLHLRISRKLMAERLDPGCDDTCLVEHLLKPGTLFGANGRDRRETRDDLVLEALTEAIEAQ